MKRLQLRQLAVTALILVGSDVFASQVPTRADALAKTRTVQTRDEAWMEAMKLPNRKITEYPDYTFISATNADGLKRYYFSKASNPVYPMWIRRIALPNGGTESTTTCTPCGIKVTGLAAVVFNQNSSAAMAKWSHEIDGRRDDALADAKFITGQTTTEYSNYTLITVPAKSGIVRYYFSKPSHPAYPAWINVRIGTDGTGEIDQSVNCETCSKNMAAVYAWESEIEKSLGKLEHTLSCDTRGTNAIDLTSLKNDVERSYKSLSLGSYARTGNSDYRTTTLKNGGDVSQFYFLKPSNPAYPARMAVIISPYGRIEQSTFYSPCGTDIDALNTWKSDIESEVVKAKAIFGERRFWE